MNIESRSTKHIGTIEPLRIGELSIPPVVAAPMAGVTDYPFRLVLRDFFSGLAYTEMLSAEAISRGNQRTMMMAKLEGGVTGIQLVGNNPETMATAAAMAEEWGAVTIDINAGCPDPNVTKKNMGAALLKDPNNLKNIIDTVADTVSVPVTVKIRSGYNEPTLEELAKAVCCSKAVAVTIHPRLGKDTYRVPADHSRTKRFVELVDGRLPVVVSGDIKDEKSTLSILEYTGAQGAMVARWMRGDPQMPYRIQKTLEGVAVPVPSLIDKTRWLLIQARHTIDYFGEGPGMKRMRKHTFWYLRGLTRKAAFTNRVNKMETLADLESVCREALSIK